MENRSGAPSIAHFDFRISTSLKYAEGNQPERGMPKTPFDDYIKEIQFQREVWQRKPVLREFYQHCYAQVVAALSPQQPTVEIGAGCGNFKAFYPDCIATDVFKSGEWIDREMDAQNLQFGAGEVGNLVAFDVLHHLQRPLKFLTQAAVALKPGGRLICCEPAVTPWSRVMYGICHHEPIDLQWDLFGLADKPPEPDPGHTFANMGIAELLFFRGREKTLAQVPDLKLLQAKKFGFVLYPLTGGFSYPSLVPLTGFRALLKCEDALTRPFANWLTGVRMLVVLEKRN